MFSVLNILSKVCFILSGLAILIFTIILDKYLAGFILFFLFFILAIAILIYTNKKMNKESA